MKTMEFKIVETTNSWAGSKYPEPTECEVIGNIYETDTVKYENH